MNIIKKYQWSYKLISTKVFAAFILLFASGMFCLYGQSKIKATSDINIRDPFVLPDAQKGVYYMYASSSQKGSAGQTLGGAAVYKSKDLKIWVGPQQVFTVPEDNWITGAVWVPEVPFLPFDRVPHTPMDRMALDGTLWVEDGTPYPVYCHEWVQIVDGAMVVVELKPDLSAPAGQPLRLFYASSAPYTPKDGKSFVTDGCFLYRTKTGKLLMIWSSFSKDGYAIGIAESTSGKILGPWKQQPKTLFSANGGHGMIFKTFDRKPHIVFHQPNSPGGAERARFFELEDTGKTLIIKK